MIREFLREHAHVNPVLSWCHGDMEMLAAYPPHDGRPIHRTSVGPAGLQEIGNLRDADALGCSGWDVERGLSVWGGADIDDLSHAAGLTGERISEIVTALQSVPWLQVQRSKGGGGVHLYWRFAPDTRAHDRAQHRGNCLCALRLVESLTGLTLVGGDVDCAGRILWLWTRIAKPKSFAVLQTASGHAPDLPDVDPMPPSEHETVALSPAHDALIDRIRRTGYALRVEGDRIQLHTAAVARVTGISTISAGRDRDQPNAYAYPVAGGKLLILRHGGVVEPDWPESSRGQSYIIVGGEDYAPMSISDLVIRHPRLAEPVIEGLLRRGETANVVAAPKVGKSWLVYHVALSIATGRELFGFPCRRGRVLILDNELDPAVLADRLPRVAGSLGIDDHRGIDVVSLRGRLLDLSGVEQHIVSRMQLGDYSAVICDAWYRFSPGGAAGENDNAAMTHAYNLIDRFAARTGAAWLLVHHTSKGSQSDKSVTDTGAGAGSMSRATDCHIVLREHEQDAHVVMEARVRSFAPVQPVVLRWEHPLWHIVEGADPTALRDPKRKAEQRRDDQGRQVILAALAEQPDSVTGIDRRTDISRARIAKLLKQLTSEGLVTIGTEMRRGNACEVFSLADLSA